MLVQPLSISHGLGSDDPPPEPPRQTERGFLQEELELFRHAKMHTEPAAQWNVTINLQEFVRAEVSTAICAVMTRIEELDRRIAVFELSPEEPLGAAKESKPTTADGEPTSAENVLAERTALESARVGNAELTGAVDTIADKKTNRFSPKLSLDTWGSDGSMFPKVRMARIKKVSVRTENHFSHPRLSQTNISANDAGVRKNVLCRRLDEVRIFVTLLVDCWNLDPWLMGVQFRLNRKVHPMTQLILCFILTMTIGTLVGIIGASFTYVYSQVNWFGESRSKRVIFVIEGSIFTVWNIAQYASFCIQCTGHLSIEQLVHSILFVGPFLFASNLVGWGLAIFCAYVIPDAHVLLHIGIVLVPTISIGIFLKIYCKLKYIQQRTDNGVDQLDSDSLGNKVQRHVGTGISMACPFSALTGRLVVEQCARPLTCFIWVVLLTAGVKLLLRAIKSLSGDPASLRVSLALSGFFFLCLLVQEVGDGLLQHAIFKATGLWSYPQRMLMIFFLIYCSITEALVCFAVVGAQGFLRDILVWARPAIECFFRHRGYFEYKRRASTLQQLHEEQQLTEEYSELDKFVSRKVIAMMSGLMAGCIVPITMSGAACYFNADSGLDMESDCDGGLVVVALEDVGPGWAVMVVEMIVLQFVYKMPMLHYYCLFDPFLIVCVFAVLCLLVSLVALSAVITV